MSLERFYAKRPYLPRDVAAQTHWEANRQQVLERYYGPYTLQTLFRVIADEATELYVDAITNQPRSLVMLEAGDVAAASTKYVLQLTRQERVNEQKLFEHEEENLQRLHIRAALGARIDHTQEFSDQERSQLLQAVRRFLQQLILTTATLGEANQQQIRNVRAEAEVATKWFHDLLQRRDSFLYEDPYGEPVLTTQAQKSARDILSAPLWGIFSVPGQPSMNHSSLDDLFAHIDLIGESFPEVDLSQIGASYYLEGLVTLQNLQGRREAWWHQGKNARHVPIDPEADLEKVKKKRAQHPLHMSPSHPTARGLKQRQLARMAQVAEPDNKLELIAAIAAQELFLWNGPVNAINPQTTLR